MLSFDKAGIDPSLGTETPEGIEYVLFPAGFPCRVSAWGIDTLIKGVFLLGLIIGLSAVYQVMGFWLYLLLNFALDWFYFTLFEIFRNGQTPGKRIMGLRVVKGDGSPVDPGSSFIRNLLRFADGFLYFYLIAFICMNASRGFRRFGDWAADTLVVYTAGTRLAGRFVSPRLRKEQSLPWLTEFPAAAPSRFLDYEEKQAILMFARRYPLLGKARASEIAKPWAALLRPEGETAPDSDFLLGIARSISGIS
jgi:uncharacterized RDD family membrane protein YckC